MQLPESTAVGAGFCKATRGQIGSAPSATDRSDPKPLQRQDSSPLEGKEIAALQQECNSKGTAPKDWTLATARKFGTDSEGHGRHPILTDARGVTEPPRRLAQQLGVTRKLENRKLALAHWRARRGSITTPAPLTWRDMQAQKGSRWRSGPLGTGPPYGGREPSATKPTSESPSHRGDQREETPRRRPWSLDGDSQACDWKSAAAH